MVGLRRTPPKPSGIAAVQQGVHRGGSSSVPVAGIGKQAECRCCAAHKGVTRAMATAVAPELECSTHAVCRHCSWCRNFGGWGASEA